MNPFGASQSPFVRKGIEIDGRRWPRTARYYRALLARPSLNTATAL
jgi:predicted NAD-dependent protein-ADP-ribosyltransferase YbiA (DUF1768 family)